jgi:S-DNA-T family DNA segregation ATPase FtsK/SpoIIIE
VIVCDEFGDLALREKREKEHFESLVARLAQKGRAAGIHLVLATQRPDRKIVTGLIKSNLPLKVCLRVTTSVNSGIVIDQPGAESLLGRGDLLCARGRGIERAQSPFISQEELRALVDG